MDSLVPLDRQGDFQSIVNFGIASLTHPGITYRSWCLGLKARYPDLGVGRSAVWAYIPEKLRRMGQVEARSKDAFADGFRMISQYKSVLGKWEELERQRKEECTPKKYRQNKLTISSDRYPLSEAFEDVSLQQMKASQALQATLLSKAKDLPTKLTKVNSILLLVGLGVVAATLLKPLGVFWPLLLLASVGKMVYDLTRRKSPLMSLHIAVALAVMVGTGILENIYVPEHPSAACSDGHYSYSAHPSGTCSWHGGVSQWAPTMHYWWEF